jgi:hypothetical protein
MSKNAQWSRATALCPPDRYGSADWLAHYQSNPDILTKMLGDLYRVYKSEEAKRAGTANPAGGRRKAHINGNLDELWSIITPKFSADPFHMAFMELKGKRSLRAFALKCGIDFRTLSHLIQSSAGTTKNGRQYPVTRYDLEIIAKAGGVHPSYFREWRELVVKDLVADMLETQPNLSITMLRGLSQ